MISKFLATAILASLPAAFGQAPVPRPAPEMKFIQADGTAVLLSKYKGKVCVVEFLFTTCPHCQQTSQVMSSLNTEFGPKGFQPLGVAFNENAIMLVPDFVKNFRVNYPVGVAPREKVTEFLGVGVNARLMVPQVAFIDKKGMIRFQSSLEGSENIHGERSMREKIEMLLAEGTPAAAKPAAKTGAPVSVKTK